MSNNRLKLNLAQAQMNQKDAQLAMLQLQLNPHFIFNTLQTVDLEIMKSQPEENSPSFLIHNLSDILKYSLENTLKRVTIREEIEICKKYVKFRNYATPIPLSSTGNTRKAFWNIPLSSDFAAHLENSCTMPSMNPQTRGYQNQNL